VFTVSSPPPLEPVCGITVAQYQKMIESGVLTDEDQVELLEGWLVPKMPRDPAHIHTTQTLRDLLPNLIGDGYFVNTQEPVMLSDSEPEPDTSILRGKRSDYRRKKPQAKDVPLIIEVANSTLNRDRVWKKRIYAKAGFAVYWIVNLDERRVEVYSQPAKPKGEYKIRRVYKKDESVPVVLDGKEVGRLSVAEILP
jgi:Uma2 family endonuclease